jgi:hypothetical protein
LQTRKVVKQAAIDWNLEGIIMAEEHTGSNTECKSDEHTKHLCYFVSYGYHVDNAEDYKDLVEQPRFKCYLCGRTAHNSESLCDPRDL